MRRELRIGPKLGQPRIFANHRIAWTIGGSIKRILRVNRKKNGHSKSEIQIMLGQMLASRRIEKNQSNIQNAKTELKSAIRMNSGIEIWDGNQMLRSHNHLHQKWHTRSKMSVQRRNGQQTWILDMAMPQVLHFCPALHPLRRWWPAADGEAVTAVSMLGVAVAILAARGRILELPCLYALIHPRHSR